MKITRSQIRKIISEALLKEEAADCIKDYMRMGYTKAQAYEECGESMSSSYGGSRRSSYRRKTSYVGASANAEQIAAVETALDAKPNNFLRSVLGQLQQGRGLSSKQKGIVKKILMKSNPEAASLFEGLILEGNHAVNYAHGYEDARDGLPQNSDDPWYAAGFADYFEGIHDQYEALHQDGITSPAAEAGPMSEGFGGDMHRCMDGTMVPSESPACYEDLQNRIDDAVYSRGHHSCGTEDRVYYNGLLKSLRRKRNRLEKILVPVVDEEVDLA